MNLDNFNEALEHITKEFNLWSTPQTQYNNESRAKIMSKHLKETESFKNIERESYLNKSYESWEIAALIKMLLDYIATNPFW